MTEKALIPTKSKNPNTRLQYLIAKRVVIDDQIKTLMKERREVEKEIEKIWPNAPK